MKKATCTTFVNILNTVHQEGISTREVLMADPALYDAFWFALKDFCHFALLSKTGGKNADGETLPGNSAKIDMLEALGAATRDAIETDCMIKVIDKLDLVLRQPLEKQKNYCYVICNNMVNDCLRKLPSDGMQIVSLNAARKGRSADSADTYTYEDILGENTYEPARLYLTRETLRTFQEERLAQLAKERAEKHDTMLRELTLLGKHPSEALCRLACTHVSMKPRELAGLILDKGCKPAYAWVLSKAAKQSNLTLPEIRSIVADHPLTAESVKADTQDPEQIACQISRLVYRAGKRLK